MPKIAVIIPVYRVEEYLKRCVDSILNQTYGDYTLVLVDDGSPDNCPQICDEYAEKDPRIHVIHQKNAGLSGARNAGLDYLLKNENCPWVVFLDSDDWLHPETLQCLLEAAEEFKVQVSVCGYEETEGMAPEIPEEKRKPELLSADVLYREQYINATIACGKLFSWDLLKDRRFPAGRLNEDEFLTYQILFAAKKLAWIPAPFYAYYVNKESITRKAWTPRRMDAWEAYEQQIAFFDESGKKEIADDCLKRYLENVNIQHYELRSMKDPGEFLHYVPLMEKKMRYLLQMQKKRGCFDFEKTFPIAVRFQPVRTRMELYRRAAVKRIRRLLCRN